MRRTLTFVVTQGCTFRCRYCYLEKGSHVMPLDVAKRALDLVLADPEFARHDGIVLDFIGGEPLLEADLIGAILDHAHERLKGHRWERAHDASLTTNGFLYNTLETQRLLASHRCLSVSMTIDGDQTQHDANRVYPDGAGTFKDVVRNVPLWLAQFPGPQTSTKMTLTRTMLPDLAHGILFVLEHLRMPRVNANVVFEETWTVEDGQEFESQLLHLGRTMLALGKPLERVSLFDAGVGLSMPTANDDNWCGSGKHMLTVDVDGRFYPCHRFTPLSLHREALPAGDVWRGIDHAVLERFSALRRRDISPLGCSTCDVESGCGWCVGHGYDESGRLCRVTRTCEMHKARVRALRTLREEAK